MPSLQAPSCRALHRPPMSSSFWGKDLCSFSSQNRALRLLGAKKARFRSDGGIGTVSFKVLAMSGGSSPSPFKMNLNEYMVTLEKPLGIRFALSVDGKIFVHALKRGSNAEKSRIIMVGDTLKKAGDSSGGVLIEIKDCGDTQKMLKEKTGTFSLVLERPYTPYPIHQLHLSGDLDMLFNREPGDGEWAHGQFPLEEYVRALDRSKGELYYDHSLGMRYSKITEQIYVGSCIQTGADVETLSNVAGVTAVLNFQSGIEAENWGINSNSINESCQRFNILMINYPIREGDSFDMRKKLPFCVGLLLRLLKKNHRVFVTCTTGFDRSPASVIAYLHWMTDTSLHAAYNFVTGLHSCRPDRPAIAWATWDLIAMVEKGMHDGPATHAVTFVWNGQEGEDVNLVGDFTGNWKEPIKAIHKGGPRFEAEVRLSQGKYYYKYIINGQWKHSTASPAERDERGNLNNVIVIGDTASIRPTVHQQKKDVNVVKVIERPLTENERFMLAKAARCVAFSVCPIRLAPK
ncbi:phosphoglucan phosphatase LSF1, chloroplastic isoform X2 [Alnus glutinosa]|uniref:phosphoglucan phosphatase LSF1, chloroplastic isoform X2 n=1 Tax=Alnus glutinosa TaxID=3517 RepID=UPI002D783CE9|nr:phosphoglucan phosphatase LSF1, chloroplastic isoform X2 [Alnus glutinosa]